jgi:hypothetical protein
MKLPDKRSGIGTLGATGITLMILHITGYLSGWAWPILYILIILAAIGSEKRNL